MTDPIALPSPEQHDQAPTEPPPSRQAMRRFLPLAVAGGFIVLAFAIFWFWPVPAPPPPSPDRAAGRQFDDLARQVDYLEARVTRLEQRPQPQTPDLAPLAARLSALEQRPAATPAAPTAPAAIPAQAPAPDLKPLEDRIATLESRQPADSQLARRIDALEAGQRTAQADIGRRIESDEARLAAIAPIAEQVARLARVQAAMLALDAGQKLGDIPGAPPALARFANASPPTEAALRLAFPKAARDALAASRPTAQGKPLLARLWAEAQDLVTIREGDRVLLGDPAAGVLEHARAALDAGDLPGAAASVASLTGPAAQAMAGWLADARALLDARAALAAWAAHA